MASGNVPPQRSEVAVRGDGNCFIGLLLFGGMSYEERCELLGWTTLERRREYFSLVECYKTVFELNGLECRDYFEFCNNNTRSNNSFKIRMKSAKVNAFKYSFFMRIIKEWNNLPTTFLEMTLILTNLNII